MIEVREKLCLKAIKLTQKRHKIPYFQRLKILNKNSRVWDKMYVCWGRMNERGVWRLKSLHLVYLKIHC